jgi:hypothetical protein
MDRNEMIISKLQSLAWFTLTHSLAIVPSLLKAQPNSQLFWICFISFCLGIILSTLLFYNCLVWSMDQH